MVKTTTIDKIIEQVKTLFNANFTEQEKSHLARTLTMGHLNITSSEMLLRRRERVVDDVSELIANDVQKINNGMPVQYVLGNTQFYGIELLVDNRVLIPRPETEELVDWIYNTIQTKEEKILDIGTGSGCIALALKTGLTKAEVFGIDKSTNALSLARENAKKLQLEVHFGTVDALDLSPIRGEQWDIIVSNPPYVLSSEKAQMQSHVVDYEPETALFVPDDDPLVFYRSIANYAFNHLNTEGQLFFEIHENFAFEIQSLLSEIGFKHCEVKKDLQGKDRMVRAVISN